MEALFKAKKAAQREEISQRRQEAALWRVQRAMQQEEEAEAALVKSPRCCWHLGCLHSSKECQQYRCGQDEAHRLALEREERDEKIKQR